MKILVTLIAHTITGVLCSDSHRRHSPDVSFLEASNQLDAVLAGKMHKSEGKKYAFTKTEAYDKFYPRRDAINMYDQAMYNMSNGDMDAVGDSALTSTISQNKAKYIQWLKAIARQQKQLTRNVVKVQDQTDTQKATVDEEIKTVAEGIPAIAKAIGILQDTQASNSNNFDLNSGVSGNTISTELSTAKSDFQQQSADGKASVDDESSRELNDISEGFSEAIDSLTTASDGLSSKIKDDVSSKEQSLDDLESMLNAQVSNLKKIDTQMGRDNSKMFRDFGSQVAKIQSDTGTAQNSAGQNSDRTVVKSRAEVEKVIDSFKKMVKALTSTADQNFNTIKASVDSAFTAFDSSQTQLRSKISKSGDVVVKDLNTLASQFAETTSASTSTLLDSLASTNVKLKGEFSSLKTQTIDTGKKVAASLADINSQRRSDTANVNANVYDTNNDIINLCKIFTAMSKILIGKYHKYQGDTVNLVKSSVQDLQNVFAKNFKVVADFIQTAQDSANEVRQNEERIDANIVNDRLNVTKLNKEIADEDKLLNDKIGRFNNSLSSVFATIYTESDALIGSMETTLTKTMNDFIHSTANQTDTKLNEFKKKILNDFDYQIREFKSKNSIDSDEASTSNVAKMDDVSNTNAETSKAVRESADASKLVREEFRQSTDSFVNGSNVVIENSGESSKRIQKESLAASADVKELESKEREVVISKKRSEEQRVVAAKAEASAKESKINSDNVVRLTQTASSLNNTMDSFDRNVASVQNETDSDAAKSSANGDQISNRLTDIDESVDGAASKASADADILAKSSGDLEKTQQGQQYDRAKKLAQIGLSVDDLMRSFHTLEHDGSQFRSDILKTRDDSVENSRNLINKVEGTVRGDLDDGVSKVSHLLSMSNGVNEVPISEAISTLHTNLNNSAQDLLKGAYDNFLKSQEIANSIGNSTRGQIDHLYSKIFNNSNETINAQHSQNDLLLSEQNQLEGVSGEIAEKSKNVSNVSSEIQSTVSAQNLSFNALKKVLENTVELGDALNKADKNEDGTIDVLDAASGARQLQSQKSADIRNKIDSAVEDADLLHQKSDNLNEDNNHHLSNIGSMVRTLGESVRSFVDQADRDERENIYEFNIRNSKLESLKQSVNTSVNGAYDIVYSSIDNLNSLISTLLAKANGRISKDQMRVINLVTKTLDFADGVYTTFKGAIDSNDEEISALKKQMVGDYFNRLDTQLKAKVDSVSEFLDSVESREVEELYRESNMTHQMADERLEAIESVQGAKSAQETITDEMNEANRATQAEAARDYEKVSKTSVNAESEVFQKGNSAYENTLLDVLNVVDASQKKTISVLVSYENSIAASDEKISEVYDMYSTSFQKLYIHLKRLDEMDKQLSALEAKVYP